MIKTNDSESGAAEAMTAEVRVVQADGTALTISGYRRLDDVGCDEIRPFGRVRTGGVGDGVVEVVGRDCYDGSLVRSSAWRTDGSNPIDATFAEWQALPLIMLMDGES